MKAPDGAFRLVLTEVPRGQSPIRWAYAIEEWNLALSEAKRKAAESNKQVWIHLVYLDRPLEERITLWNSARGML